LSKPLHLGQVHNKTYGSAMLR